MNNENECMRNENHKNYFPNLRFLLVTGASAFILFAGSWMVSETCDENANFARMVSSASVGCVSGCVFMYGMCATLQNPAHNISKSDNGL